MAIDAAFAKITVNICVLTNHCLVPKPVHEELMLYECVAPQKALLLLGTDNQQVLPLQSLQSAHV